MKKGWNEYQTYIFDMDGTLYYQAPFRKRMFREMLRYYMCHMNRWKQAFVLRDYRRMREDAQILARVDFEENIRKMLVNAYSYSKEKIDRIIAEWIYERPLPFLAEYRDEKLAEEFVRLHEQKKQLLIYSDYPAERKAEVLGLKVDGCYSPDGMHILFLKPDASGLNYILNQLDITKEEVLYIGDRYEKDGICAQTAGIDYCILPRNKRKRQQWYKEIGL